MSASPQSTVVGTRTVTDSGGSVSVWIGSVADRGGRVHVAIVNPKLGGGGRGMYVAYEKAAMPRYIEWRMMAEGQYAVGIEPCTNGFGREAVRAAGELIVLQPGDRRTYRTEVGVLEDATAIAAFRKAVER